MDAKLVFTDETGLLMAPLVRSSLAPAAHTPVIRIRAKHRQKVSVIAALFHSARGQRVRLMHRLFIDQYVDDFFYAEFLRECVLARSRRALVLVQDNAPLHLGPSTQEVMEDFYHRLQVFQSPHYAPELNPTEQLWSCSKDKKLANFVADELGDLAAATEHVVNLAEHDPNDCKRFSTQPRCDGLNATRLI